MTIWGGNFNRRGVVSLSSIGRVITGGESLFCEVRSPGITGCERHKSGILHSRAGPTNGRDQATVIANPIWDLRGGS